MEDTTGLTKICEEITEELEYEPGSLFVNRYIRPKYAKGESDGRWETITLLGCMAHARRYFDKSLSKD